MLDSIRYPGSTWRLRRIRGRGSRRGSRGRRKSHRNCQRRRRRKTVRIATTLNTRGSLRRRSLS
jgi:hypothetical protein